MQPKAQELFYKHFNINKMQELESIPMNKYIKQYCKHVETLFPVIKKEERLYLNKLENQLEDFCDEHPIHSLNQLYDEYGVPSNIVNDYYSSLDTDRVIERIKQAKIARVIILFMLILTLLASTVAVTKSVLYYKAYQEAIANINGHWEDEIH